jgi:hypothetical protein
MNRMIGAVVALMVVSWPALAADRKIRPLPLDQCRVLAETLGRVAAIPLSARVGRPAFPAGVSGDACLLSGKATGLGIGFMAAQDRLDRSLAEWKRVPDYDADGPYGTLKGFTKGEATLLYQLETGPPAGTCDNVVIADCKVPRVQWHWTLEVVGFVQ